MHKKSLSNVDELDRLARYYGMPRPHCPGGFLPILHEDPTNIVVVRAGGTFHTNDGTEVREAVVLEESQDRFVKVTNWLKSIVVN